MTLQVKAKQSFYHELVGSRAHGEVFQVDQTTLQALEQAGYIERLDANAESANAQQEAQKRQVEMGQAQAQANEEVSQARHNQNMQANQHTQQINQEAQQRAQQGQPQIQADPDPSAVNAKATAKKANEK